MVFDIVVVAKYCNIILELHFTNSTLDLLLGIESIEIFYYIFISACLWLFFFPPIKELADIVFLMTYLSYNTAKNTILFVNSILPFTSKC